MLDPLVFYKALADETRLKSLLLIQLEGELCVCELMAALNESQPKVSRHLALLKQDNILLDRRQGQWIYYRLNPNLPEWASGVLRQTAVANPLFIKVNVKQLCNMGERPERVKSCC
jgi:ArsR family transcriptional regulator, arsenate/arsenite/antimonite-responsive transcriptional repressor